MRHIIPVSGKDSCATAIVQTTLYPDLPYELFFSDVGCELPETYAWLDRVEKILGRKIVRVGKSLIDVIRDQDILPSPERRFCTKYAKIRPLEKHVGSEEAVVYLGIRADEDRVGGFSSKSNITYAYPLVDNGITLPVVYTLLEKRGIVPPDFFWERLFNQVSSQMDRENRRGFGLNKPFEEIYPSYPRWLRSELFSWRTRPNCYFCFFQRKYEWVGLLEHHPDLFDAAERVEWEIGSVEARPDRVYRGVYWRADGPLSEIRRNADNIFGKRVKAVVGMIHTKNIVGEADDLLAVTSCGLFCGK